METLCLSTTDVLITPSVINSENLFSFEQFPFSVICGLTAFTTKYHIIRAALETVCYQITDVIEAMKKDAGIHLTKLHVDGKMAQNNLLMQLQADISGIPICRF